MFTQNSHDVMCIFVQLLDQNECLTLQVKQLTLDCNMHQQKSTVYQNQMRELQTERDQVRLFQDTVGSVEIETTPLSRSLEPFKLSQSSIQVFNTRI